MKVRYGGSPGGANVSHLTAPLSRGLDICTGNKLPYVRRMRSHMYALSVLTPALYLRPAAPADVNKDLSHKNHDLYTSYEQCKGLFTAHERNRSGVRELQCEQPHWNICLQNWLTPTVLVSLSVGHFPYRVFDAPDNSPPATNDM